MLSIFSKKVENSRMKFIVYQIFTIYHIKGNRAQYREDIVMNYRRIIISILDSLGANKSYRGYDYVVYGMQLMLEDEECVTCITKSLYIDIAKYYHTTWNCVEKNIRTLVKDIWNSGNRDLFRIIFRKSVREKKPTNKEFFKYIYEYISEMDRKGENERSWISVICPISNQYCESLSVYYTKLLSVLDDTRTNIVQNEKSGKSVKAEFPLER